mgnify:FL=1
MKKKTSRSWVIKQHRDPYFKQAKSLNYRSRSAFKLIELNEKFNLIKNNQTILDLGSSPGGWSQVIKKFSKNCKIIAVDINSMDPIDGVVFKKKDFLSNIFDLQPGDYSEKFDLILSDMAEKTTGNKSLDCIRTNHLGFTVIDFSTKFIKSEGHVISKLFMGEDFLSVKKFAQKKFKKVDFFKPNSSRKDSKETYIHCKGLKSL